MASKTEVTVALFGNVSPVASPGAGGARIGTQLRLDITAAANNPIAYDSCISSETDSWELSAGAVTGSSVDSYIVAGESVGWPARGWLITCDAVDPTGDTTGYAIITELAGGVKRLFFGGAYLYVKSGGADDDLNSGTTVTGGAIEADDNIYTKAAHGFVTGDRVLLDSLTGGTGLTAGNYYYFHRLSSSTGYLCSTPALAAAGTAINVTLDATDVVLSMNQTEVDDVLEITFDAVSGNHENLRVNLYAIC